MKTHVASARQILLTAVAPLLAALSSQTTEAAPQGPQVVAGSAAISGAGNSLLIRQSTNRAIIDWSTFSINQNETVQFALPTSLSAVLNRVTSLTPSQLNGTLLSNGSVYLINPSGIIIGPRGQIDVQTFVASSLDVNNTTFMSGSQLIFSGSSTASVVNLGAITAAGGGSVSLIAQQVQNEGTISAPGGSVNLAAGAEVLLQQSATPGITVRVTGNGSVTNTGLVQTTVAQLAANGGNAMALAINNTGIIRASGVKNINGRIYLTAGPSAEADNNGTLDASSTTAQGGQVVLTAQHILIGSESRIFANGPAGGGQIFIGGSWENDNPAIPQALGVWVQGGAIVEASATQSGDGGTIALRSDVTNPQSFTRAYGDFIAKGAGAGIGGQIETSGYSLDTTGITVSASAPSGHSGQWLLDPYNLVISNATANFNTSGSPWVPTASGGTISSTTINNTLDSGSSVTISTGTPGSDLGNISVNSPIDKSSGLGNVTLALDASNNITINQNITAESGILNLVFDAHEGTAGAIILAANLTSNGGAINFGTGRTSGGSLVGGDVYFNGPSAQSIATSGGTLTFNGQILIANPSGLTLSTSGGNIIFQGTVDSGDTYTFVNASVNWDTAEVDAKGATAGGASIGDTYLATVTSSLENTIASNAANYQASWLGGHRPLVNGTTSQTWYWVTGPEGLQNGGKGLAFFTENFTGGGGTAINGAFTNWNGGEPNNSGGSNTTQNGESALQFLGTGALWNDLSENGQTLPYLVETNLAPSSLIVNASSGQVTFNGRVGGNKPLASLTVTGPTAINGGGVITTGSQAFNNAITLGATSTTLSVTQSDLNLAQNITYTGSTNASLTLQASGSVTIAANTTIQANGTGDLSVTLDSHNSAGVDSGNSGAIFLGNNAVITTNGGAITMGGGVSPSSTPAFGTSTNPNGIYLNGATLNSGGGAVTLTGTGLSASSSAANGILIASGGSITTSSGPISLTGIAGPGGSITNFGIEMNTATLTSTSGNLTLTADTAELITSVLQSPGQLLIQPETASTSIALGDGVNATLDLDSAELAQIQSGFSLITIGSPSGTGPISISTFNFPNAAKIQSPDATTDNITLSGALSTTIGSITLITGGTIIGSAATSILTNNPADVVALEPSSGASLNFTAITTSNLLLLGSGPFHLSNTSNQVGTIAANLSTGDLQFTDSQPLTVGSINSTSGVSAATGLVTLVSASDITVTQPVSAAGTGTTIVLAAGGNFSNSAGGSAINPGSGRFLLYSTNPAHNSLGGLTAAGNLYGVTYTGNPPGSITAAGNQFLYSYIPTLTLTADAESKVYGQSNPTFTYTPSGFIGGDTAAEAISGSPAITTPATSASAVGNYTIDIASGALVSNLGYAFDFVPGNLSITAAPLTITANNASKAYGAALPAFSATYAGLVNGDTSTVVSGLTFTTPANASSSVGDYALTPLGATASNYSITFGGATLAITPAALTIAADNQARLQKIANPILTATFIGLAPGDPPSVIPSVTLTTTAQQNSSVGTYPIDITSGSNPNYTITPVDGQLVVVPLPLIAIQTQWQSSDALAPNFTGSTGSLPIAQITPPAATNANAPGVLGNLFYRGSLPPRHRSNANLTVATDQLLDNAIVHISSFDVANSDAKGK